MKIGNHGFGLVGACEREIGVMPVMRNGWGF